MGTDKRKQSLYFPDEILNEMNAEAGRLDRSLSWLVQAAWKLSKDKIARLPTHSLDLVRDTTTVD